MKKEILNDNEISKLYENIRLLVEQSRNKVYRVVNTEMIYLYWNIGKAIIEK